MRICADSQREFLRPFNKFRNTFICAIASFSPALRLNIGRTLDAAQRAAISSGLFQTLER